MPIVIQLEGGYDGTQFWTQKEVTNLLREQTLAAVNDHVPRSELVEEMALPDRLAEPAPTKYSFWGRKQSKALEAKSPAKPNRPPVTVNVEQDQFDFRRETLYGLLETLQVQAVLITVDVR
jgi:hypothetical protein